MLNALLSPVLAWLGIGLVPFFLLVLIVFNVLKGD